MILIDSNVLIDIWTRDERWGEWSARNLAACLQAGPVGINPVIYAELSLGFQTERDLNEAVGVVSVTKLPLPLEEHLLPRRPIAVEGGDPGRCRGPV